jgi:hypothetical protein
LATNIARPLSGATLQFAIYPWDYALNAPIYDISGTPGQFRARDIQGSDREITAESWKDWSKPCALSRPGTGQCCAGRGHSPLFQRMPSKADFQPSVACAPVSPVDYAAV